MKNYKVLYTSVLLLIVILIYFNLPIFNPYEGIGKTEQEEYNEFKNASSEKKKLIIKETIREFDLDKDAKKSAEIYLESKKIINDIIIELENRLIEKSFQAAQSDRIDATTISSSKIFNRRNKKPIRFSFAFETNDSLRLYTFFSINEQSVLHISVYYNTVNEYTYLKDLTFDENIYIENQSNAFKKYPGISLEDQLSICLYEYADYCKRSNKDFKVSIVPSSKLNP